MSTEETTSFFRGTLAVNGRVTTYTDRESQYATLTVHSSLTGDEVAAELTTRQLVQLATQLVVSAEFLDPGISGSRAAAELAAYAISGEEPDNG